MVNVLIIEDNSLVAHTLSEGLTYEGYDVVIANTVEEGNKQLKKRPFDILLLDLLLPDDDGTNLLRSLRQKSDMPVIIISSKE